MKNVCRETPKILQHLNAIDITITITLINFQRLFYLGFFGFFFNCPLIVKIGGALQHNCDLPLFTMAAIFYLILLLLLIANSTISLQMPSTRPFISLVEGNDPIASTSTILDSFRILQLNMLADGLSGLRADFGAFSRVNGEDLKWENRKVQLIYEILQYKPDCITLQECDHYYDFFLPELQAMGYDGLFAPKPSSACLEVSENSDGCAMFLKRDKFRVVSTEVSQHRLRRYRKIA